MRKIISEHIYESASTDITAKKRDSLFAKLDPAYADEPCIKDY